MLDTVRGVVEAGVPAEAVVVVDNSEDDGIADGLRAAAHGWTVLTVPNHGYGAAANIGVAAVADSEVVLVLTHEVVIDAPSLAAVISRVREDPRVAASGPALMLTDGDQVWSRGGSLSPRLLIPRGIQTASVADAADTDVHWLDGACVAYRTSVLLATPFREDFFLYFEETDLHARLRADGWRVVTATGSTAHQGTQGMPSYLGCRNFVMFVWAHGGRLARIVAPLHFTLRSVAIAVQERRWTGVQQSVAGLLAGYQSLARGRS
ncbi:glycosyltransferase family 2 protein [Phycicoccus sp. CMS6Z-2]|uniref:Glycosyltransferase family 2 protein n=1 Tax=Phycicoccus flavus TaxID=2502783 RepID=A0A8T6R3W0_9MICO|nr:glycosyltransferase family 2 protein [Phycicoccus flavus]